MNKKFKKRGGFVYRGEKEVFRHIIFAQMCVA